jgi:hypothetical protein
MMGENTSDVLEYSPKVRYSVTRRDKRVRIRLYCKLTQPKHKHHVHVHDEPSFPKKIVPPPPPIQSNPILPTHRCRLNWKNLMMGLDGTSLNLVTKSSRQIRVHSSCHCGALTESQMQTAAADCAQQLGLELKSEMRC